MKFWASTFSFPLANYWECKLILAANFFHFCWTLTGRLSAILQPIFRFFALPLTSKACEACRMKELEETVRREPIDSMRDVSLHRHQIQDQRRGVESTIVSAKFHCSVEPDLIKINEGNEVDLTLLPTWKLKWRSKMCWWHVEELHRLQCSEYAHLCIALKVVKH